MISCSTSAHRSYSDHLWRIELAMQLGLIPLALDLVILQDRLNLSLHQPLIWTQACPISRYFQLSIVRQDLAFIVQPTTCLPINALFSHLCAQQAYIVGHQFHNQPCGLIPLHALPNRTSLICHCRS